MYVLCMYYSMPLVTAPKVYLVCHLCVSMSSSVIPNKYTFLRAVAKRFRDDAIF